MKTKECSNYFDEINNENKAYWIGFIWSDGYVWIRKKEKRSEYGFKLDLSDVDEEHLYKLKNDMKIRTSIKHYNKYKNAFPTNNGVSRVSCYDKHLIEILQNKYGIIPRRTNCFNLIKNIPNEYLKDFIRGILDADGSFTKYVSHIEKENRDEIKYTVAFCGNNMLLNFIEDVFIQNNLIPNTKRILSKRHKDKDFGCYNLKISGKNNFYNVLNWLYEDSDVYLDRKYEKYMKYKKEDFRED